MASHRADPERPRDASATSGCTSAAWAPTRTAPSCPIIVRGEGCHVWDEHGKRYFDGLSALFCVNIGHGRHDVAQAGADQAKELGLLHELVLRPPARDRARRARSPSLAPGRPQPRLLHERRQRGRRVRDQARPPVPQAHAASRTRRRSSPARRRLPRDHARGAHARRASRACARRSSRSRPAAATCRTPTSTACPRATEPRRSPRRSRERIEFEGPDTVAAVILEPVQNAGGCFTPPDGYFQRVREICDEYDVLLISDEVICSWGRLGEWFGAQRYDYQPDIITTAKGITSRLRADGRGHRLRPARRAVPAGHRVVHARLHLRWSPDRRRGRAARTSTSSRTRASSTTSARTRPRFRAMLEVAARHPDRRRRARRGLLPRDRARQGPRHASSPSAHEESETLLRGFLSDRALRPRPDLPRRRPRRPGRPALAAAHRRAGASSPRSSPCCARCSPRPPRGCC